MGFTMTKNRVALSAFIAMNCLAIAPSFAGSLSIFGKAKPAPPALPAVPTIVDANGKFVGYAMGQRPSYDTKFVSLTVTIKAENSWGNAYLNPQYTGFARGGLLTYLSPGCVGQPFIGFSGAMYSVIEDALIGNFANGAMAVVVADPSKTTQYTAPLSMLDSAGVCTEMPGNLTYWRMTPAIIVPATSLGWTPPFRVAPAQ